MRVPDDERVDVCEALPVRVGVIVALRLCVCDADWLGENVGLRDPDELGVSVSEELCEMLLLSDWLSVCKPLAVPDCEVETEHDAVDDQLGVTVELADVVALGVSV